MPSLTRELALIDTKAEQLAAIVNTYQALGGGVLTISTPADFHGQFPYTHTVRSGENFWTISLLYYRSGRYCKALWAANKNAVPAFDRLAVGDKIIIPRPDQLDPALIEEDPAPAPPIPETVPGDKPATIPRSRPRPRPRPRRTGVPGPFGQEGTKDPAVKATGGNQPPRGLAEASRWRTFATVLGVLQDGPRIGWSGAEDEALWMQSSTWAWLLRNVHPGPFAMFRTIMRRLLTSVDSEAINFTTWMSCIVCPEFWVPSHVEAEYNVRGRGLHPASRRICEAIW